MCEAVVDPVVLDDAGLTVAISEWAAVEARAAARRLACIAELVDRRCSTELAADREHWYCDAWDSAVAEVAAGLAIGHRAASTLARQALALRDRLPRVGALLAEGSISLRVANTLTWRTVLVTDPALLALVDAELAQAATTYGRLSEATLVDKVDAVIERHDPDAVRRFRTVVKNMNVGFGAVDDDTGTRSMWGRLTAIDAALAEQRLQILVGGLCPQDPRTPGERRSAAMGVMAVQGDHLPCLCRRDECPSAGPDPRAEHIVIHVLTDAGGSGGEGGPDDGDGGNGGGPDDGPNDDPTPNRTPGTPAPCSPTAVMAGGGIIPTPLLDQLIAMGAALRPLLTPADLCAEPGYRPSAALARFVRARDLTCTFPGCNHPAQFCDVDHTIPYDLGGLTHPGNLKALCRKHHLLKTFWVGRGGWSDRQLPDGTIVWTSPSGIEHRAPPGSRIYFPDWDTTTPVPHTATTPRTSTSRGLMMPTRKTTRTRQYAQSIHTERERNKRAAEENPAPF